jgi:hypothetical protein
MPTALPKAFILPDAAARTFCHKNEKKKEKPLNPLCLLWHNLLTVYAALGPASSRCGTLAAIIGWKH